MNPCVLKRQTALNNKSCNATVVESKKNANLIDF